MSPNGSPVNTDSRELPGMDQWGGKRPGRHTSDSSRCRLPRGNSTEDSWKTLHCPQTYTTPFWSLATASRTLLSFLGTLKLKRQCGWIPRRPSDRSSLKVSGVFLWQRLWPERGQGQLLRGPWAKECTVVENTDRNLKGGGHIWELKF